MGYTAKQDDINILMQGSQEFFIRVELCDSSYKILDSLEGVVLSDNFSVNNSSLQRRTYNCELVILDSSFLIGEDKKIWLNKRLRIYYGSRSIRTGNILWYRLGTFCYVNVNYTVTQNERRLSLTCADLMSQYDGTLNGQVGGFGSANSDSSITAQGLTIPAGEDIRGSIIATLKDARIGSYIVEDIGKEIPYDLKFNTGVTYAEVWKKICELYDSWEFFFDIDGNFIWRKIPTCLEESVVLNDEIMHDIVVSESANSSFSGIYNATEVWGKVLELEHDDRYADSSTYVNNIYNIHLDLFKSWDDVDNLTQFGFRVCSENIDFPKFSINGYSPIPILDGDGNPLIAKKLQADTIYVFRYRRQTVNENGIVSALYLLGQYQCYGKYVEESLDCPFSVPNLGYQIMRSLDYSGLSDDAACYNQAEYLTYSTTAMMDTLSLTTLIVPWLDVNMKVEYAPYSSGIKAQYIIKGLNWSIANGTMTLTLYKFLEDFSFVYNRKKGGD